MKIESWRFAATVFSIKSFVGYDSCMNEPLTLSIAIVNWNTRQLLIGVLESIFGAPPTFELEVIVVDNASSDQSAEAVISKFPQVTLIANQNNRGYAEGNNQAIEASTGKFVLMLNPDVILPEGALERAVKFMQDRPQAGALGVRQIHPDGKLQRSVRGFPTPAAICWELVGLSRLFPKNQKFGAYRMTWFGYDSIVEVDQPMGAFLLIRREALEQVGLLDLKFPIFFNEVDWCLRCKRAGWKIYFTPEVEIIHYGGASTMQVGASMAWESRRGLLAFYGKHYRSPLLYPLRLLIAIASYPHAWLQSRQRNNKKA